MEIKGDVIRLNNNNEIKLLDLIWFIIIPIINVNYILASILAKKGADLTSKFDDIIPFNSGFIIPYIYWYVYIVIGFMFILVNSRKEYIRVFISFFIGMSISYVIYYLYPTQIARPIIQNSNILNHLVNIIYLLDRPVNCFPSLHVLTTYFIMRYTKYKYSKMKFYYTQITGVLIILSTLFIKQHFIVDVISAIFLGEIIIFLVKKIDNSTIEKILNLPYKIKYKSKIKNKEIIQHESKLVKNKK